MRSVLARIVAQEDLNFLLTNRLPRRLATRFIGWFSKIENPIVSRGSIAAWKMFADLDLSDAAQTKFRSMHDCFTRALKPGARPIDQRAEILVSPCDAIVGACGQIDEDRLYQVKGFPYTLGDLLGPSVDDQAFRDGRFVTLRLTSSMYHRFHAPHDLSVDRVNYISGDTWNVNPIALKRVEKLFCKNERAVVHCKLAATGQPILLVPVAAILVACIRFHFCDALRQLRSNSGRSGVNHQIDCDATFAKGQEMGWFEHGSTIIVFTPDGFELAQGVSEGTGIRMGQALMRIPK
jgi:phosphatidylserine decarboxylase